MNTVIATTAHIADRKSHLVRDGLVAGVAAAALTTAVAVGLTPPASAWS